MSTTEHIEETEAPERALLVRSFGVEAEVGDGRTLDMRVVPFDELGNAADPPHYEPYQEQFMPGAFSRQENAAHRVLLTVDHLEGLQGVIGHGLSLREERDGYYGSFRIHESSDGDKAITLLREKVFEFGSIEFYPLKTIRTRSGVRQRVKAHLDKLTLTRKTPSYKKTAVLGLREEAEVTVDEEFLTFDPPEELLARCRALGIRLPQRYTRHPDETDTSAQTDTSEDGTPLPAND